MGDEQDASELGRLRVAASIRARLVGLLGAERNDAVLMLAPCNDVHTFGMRLPIDIAFVGEGGEVLASHRNVGRNRRLRKRKAVITLERFATPGESWPEKGDRLSLAWEKRKEKGDEAQKPERKEHEDLSDLSREDV